MSTTVPVLQHWMHAIQLASHDFAYATLRLAQGAKITEYTSHSQKQIKGAFVPLTSKQGTIQIGFLSSDNGCRKLAQIYWRAKAAKNVSEEDIDTAVRKTAAILASRSKTLIPPDFPATNMGLPILIKGQQQLNLDGDLLYQSIRLGEIECFLVVFHHSKKIT